MGYQGLLRRLIPGNHQLFRENCLISTPPSGICDKVLENKCLSLISHVFSRIILGHRRSIVNVGSGCGSVPSGDMLWPEPVLTKNLSTVWRNVAVIIRSKNDKSNYLKIKSLNDKVVASHEKHTYKVSSGCWWKRWNHTNKIIKLIYQIS